MGLSNNLSCEAGSLSCCRPTPRGAFNQRFEALFPRAGALGWVVFFAPPPVCLVYLCMNVGPWGATHRSACPVLHNSESGPLCLSARMWAHRVCQWSDCLPHSSHTLPVSVLPRPCKSSPPWLPVSTPPTCLDECLFFISLGSDLLAVGFSVSSGCARRCSVSTYTTILVLPSISCVF